MEGQGSYLQSDGSKYEGEFKENELWNGIEYDREGKKIRTVHLGV